MRIGEILVKNGILESYHIEYALEQQKDKKSNKLLGQVLLDKKLIDKNTLINTLAEQHSTPGINILETEIDPKALFSIKSTQAHKYNVLPFKLAAYRSGSLLYLATHTPNDFSKIEDISFITGYPVKPFYALESDIRTAITICYNRARKIS